MKYTIEYYSYDWQQGEKPHVFHFKTREEMYKHVDIQLKTANNVIRLDFLWLEDNTYCLSEYKSEIQIDVFKITPKDLNERSIIDIDHSLN